MDVKNGGPAFPIPAPQSVAGTGGCFVPPAHGGMTLRQWYAGHALAMLDTAHSPSSAAKRAFEIADAMIAQGEEG